MSLKQWSNYKLIAVNIMCTCWTWLKNKLSCFLGNTGRGCMFSFWTTVPKYLLWIQRRMCLNVRSQLETLKWTWLEQSIFLRWWVLLHFCLETILPHFITSTLLLHTVPGFVVEKGDWEEERQLRLGQTLPSVWVWTGVGFMTFFPRHAPLPCWCLALVPRAGTLQRGAEVRLAGFSGVIEARELVVSNTQEELGLLNKKVWVAWGCFSQSCKNCLQVHISNWKKNYSRRVSATAKWKGVSEWN